MGLGGSPSFRVLLAPRISRGHFYLTVFFRVMHDGLSERGTTRSLMRAYRIIILTVWVLTLLFTALFNTTRLLFSFKRAAYYQMPYVFIIIFIICGCNIGIWRKFRRGNIASQQQNRNSRNKRLTKTLLFLSIFDLLCWIPLVI